MFLILLLLFFNRRYNSLKGFDETKRFLPLKPPHHLAQKCVFHHSSSSPAAYKHFSSPLFCVARLHKPFFVVICVMKHGVFHFSFTTRMWLQDDVCFIRGTCFLLCFLSKCLACYCVLRWLCSQIYPHIINYSTLMRMKCFLLFFLNCFNQTTRDFLSVQTAKFNEPVTLDFLDAEMESEIKVEVGEIVFSSSFVAQGFASEIIPARFFIKPRFYYVSLTDTEENDWRVNRGLHNSHSGEVTRRGELQTLCSVIIN